MSEEPGITPRLQSNVTPAAGTGQALRQTREAQGMTVEDVCRRLRYSRDTIRNLENERFERLPEPIYAIGYIKAYSRYLGIDPERMIEQYKARTGHVPEEAVVVPEEPDILQESASRPPWRQPWLQWGVPATVAGIAALVWIWMDSAGDPAAQAVQGDGMIVAVPEVAAGDSDADAADRRAGEDESIGESGDAPVGQPVESGHSDMALFEHPEPPDAETAGALAGEGGPGDGTDGTQFAEMPGGPDVLDMTYIEGSWTEVYDADKRRLLFDLVKSGDRRTVEGRAPFMVRLGKSDAVEIEINGAPFEHGRFARPDRTAQFSVAVHAE